MSNAPKSILYCVVTSRTANPVIGGASSFADAEAPTPDEAAIPSTSGAPLGPVTVSFALSGETVIPKTPKLEATGGVDDWEEHA
jgi:hypothetical protein